MLSASTTLILFTALILSFLLSLPSFMYGLIFPLHLHGPEQSYVSQPHGFMSVCLAAQSCPTLWPCGLQPIRRLCPWDSPGKKTGVGCHALLQGIFPTQRQNPGLPTPGTASD